jgi:tetratricopeptide (TPR) repeat protein
MLPTVDQILQEGISAHRAGKVADAERLYYSILELEATHADANHNLGVLAVDVGRLELSLRHFSIALQENPKKSQYWFSMIDALIKVGHLDKARKVLEHGRDFGLTGEKITQFSKQLSSKNRKFNSAEVVDALTKKQEDVLFVLHKKGHYEELIRQASMLSEQFPSSAMLFISLGVANAGLNRFDTAIENYQRAIELDPHSAETHRNLGNAWTKKGELNKAITSYRQAIEIKPDYAQAYDSLGNALREIGEFNAAIGCHQRAIKISPDLAELHNNLGNSLQEIGEWAAAVKSYQCAIELKPNFVPAYSNLGIVLKAQNKLDAAIDNYRRAIELSPEYAEAHSNLGNALKEKDELEAAADSHRRAIELKPEFAAAHSNLGNALQEMGELNAALRAHQRAIDLEPGFVEAHWNKSLLLLMMGKLRRGFELYEWRWQRKIKKNSLRSFDYPLWLGAEDLKGKTIILHCEQGFGDTIQFCRYVRLVKDLGAIVTLEVDNELFNLLRNLPGVGQVIKTGNPLSHYDYHCPLMSLPLALGTELDSIPSPQKYLVAEEEAKTKWKKILGDKKNIRVGIAWSGSPTHKNDSNRSIQLSEFIEYLPPNVEYVSLQKNLRASDIELLQNNSQIIDCSSDWLNFSDTAALCDLMDIIITVDTSIAHIAGALGKNTWVLLSFFPDWRWLEKRSDSPWYSGVKLYRQTTRQNWQPVFKQIKKNLLAII